MSHVIGIDLGGAKIALGLVNSQDQIIARRRIETRSEQGLASVIERIAGEVEALKGLLPAGETVTAAGVGAPGPVDHLRGELLTLVNLPGISNTPFRDALSRELGLPVALDHDAKAAALGEFHFGAGTARSSMIFIVAGTGVGAAIIYQGRLIYGESNSAGESGHMTVDPQGHRCHCGSRGCLEMYASGPAIARQYAALTGKRVAGGQITQLARTGDADALAVFQEAGRALGIAIASLAMTLNIELFVIGGGVAAAGELLLAPARESLRGYAFAAVADKIRLRRSALGDDAPLLGAAWLARHSLGD